jgi:predicted O-methyltransferase YrrM
MIAIRPRLTKFVKDATRTIIQLTQQEQRGQRNVEVALTALLRNGDLLSKANDAAAYVEFLRTCIEPMAQRIVTVKPDSGPKDARSNRFTNLIDVLRSDLLPVSIEIALALAEEADRYRGLAMPFDREWWSGDVGQHFSISSSLGPKGRILSNIVRLSRAERCLELGTAYGLSSMFILEMQRSMGQKGHLTTIEGSNPQYSLAAERLTQRYGAAVTCHFAHSLNVLPELVRAREAFDFMFHDAGHSREDYINDFRAAVDALAPGAIVLIDDIRWEDPRFKASPNTYRGWLDVVAHARVRHAVEVGGAMGLALLN